VTASLNVSGAPAAAGGGAQIQSVSDELSARRTGMSFQRTRLSAERTLMSVIRTSLSLIGFGFTIFQFFRHMQTEKVFHGPTQAPRNFGAALIYLGVGILIIGIVYHAQFMVGLRRMRNEMAVQGLIRAQSGFPVSFTLIAAIVLLLIGLAAIGSLTFHVGPFD
jgi:putative membrane protein